MVRFSIIAIAHALATLAAAQQAAFIAFNVNGASALNDTQTIDGEAYIQLKNYNIAIKTPSSSTSGAGAGKPVASPLTFTHLVDRNTAKFFQYQIGGGVFDSAVILIMKNNQVVAKYNFTHVIIVDQEISVTPGVDAIETVSFNYSGIQLVISAIQPDGTLSSAETGEWRDVVNTAMPTGVA